jgi:hypothetical protein
MHQPGPGQPAFQQPRHPVRAQPSRQPGAMGLCLTSWSSSTPSVMAKQPIAATESEYASFRRLLPPHASLELLVLKGRLLVEGPLRVFLRASSRHPESLDDARLHFMQTAHLVRALGGVPEAFPWDAAPRYSLRDRDRLDQASASGSAVAPAACHCRTSDQRHQPRAPGSHDRLQL